MSAFGDLFNDLGGEGIEVAGLARGDHALVDDDGPTNGRQRCSRRVAASLSALISHRMAQGRQTSLAQHQQRQQRDNDRRGEANNEKNALLAPTQDDFAPARVLGGVSLRLGAFLSNHRAMNGPGATVVPVG